MKTSSKNTNTLGWITKRELRAKSKANGSCREWTGAKVCIGYGRIGRHNKQWLVHRVSKFLHHDVSLNDFLNPRVVFRHKCHNPSCIKPSHIVLGTQQENIADRVQAGRTAKHLDRRDKQGRFI